MYIISCALLQLAPNPAHKFLNFKTDLENQGIINIFDSKGQFIVNLNIDSGNTINELDVRDWLNGIYFYQLISDDDIIDNGKFIVQH